MEENSIPILRWLLTEVPASSKKEQTFPGWKKMFHALEDQWDMPVDRALAAGFNSDRIAYAFTGGYESALRLLVPSLPKHTLASLCVTEEGGGHPRAIHAKLEPAHPGEEGLYQVSGRKKFVTAADESELLITAVSRGEMPDGRNDIAVVLINRKSPGVTMDILEDLPFVPEISHGSVRFDRVAVREDMILPGDGFSRYIRPFRTIEDIHVFGAVLGYLFRVAVLFAWPEQVKEKMLAQAVVIRSLATMDPMKTELHIALGGVHRFLEDFIIEIQPYFQMADNGTRKRWERDRPLLNVSGTARSKRLEKAWKSIRK